MSFYTMITSVRTSINRGVIIIQRFASLYESFQALTSIQTSHFVEWFSGSDIDSIWTKLTQVGSPVFAMSDVVDDGFRITGPAGDQTQGILNFNDKRHYTHDASVIIFVFRRHSTVTRSSGVGFLADSTNITSTGIPDNAWCIASSSNSNYQLNTADASTPSSTASSVALDLNFHSFKIECGSANIKLTVDGVLEVTKTTNRPTAKMQPTVLGLGSTASFVPDISIKYLECYNTSVSILSSLYERLSALTQVMNQRVVETFSGSVLNERWTVRNVTGTGSASMADEIDGGVQLVTSAGSSAQTHIDFNGIDQYDETDCICIFVAKRTTAVSARVEIGLRNAPDGVGTNTAIYSDLSSETFKQLGTADGSTFSFSASDVAVDTNYHVVKIECGSANIKLTIDGVLKVTKTTNRPALPLMPVLSSRTTGAGAATIQCTYFEAYNKLSAETDYPSVYELFNPLTTIVKSHFWEWFDGTDLHNRWTFVDILGTGSGEMADEIDGGYQITSGGSDLDRSAISFNNKRQYDPVNSVCIAVVKRDVANSSIGVGLGGEADMSGGSSDDKASMWDSTSNTFKKLLVADGTSGTSTDTDITTNTNWTGVKLVLVSANIKLFLDGVLKVTDSTSSDRPNSDLQPAFTVRARSSGAKTGSIRYIEAYNT